MFLLDAFPFDFFQLRGRIIVLVIGMEGSYLPRIRQKADKENRAVKAMQLPGGREGPSSKRWLAMRGLDRRAAKRDQAL
jgi:hypothetical protein